MAYKAKCLGSVLLLVFCAARPVDSWAVTFETVFAEADPAFTGSFLSLDRGDVAYVGSYVATATERRSGLFVSRSSGGVETLVRNTLPPGFKADLRAPSISRGEVVFAGSSPSENGLYIFNSGMNEPQAIVNTTSPIPGGNGTFVGPFATPSYNRARGGLGWVVFNGMGSQSQQGVYLASTSLTLVLEKIADLNTSVSRTVQTPSGPITVSGKFVGLGLFPSVEEVASGKKNVAFYGTVTYGSSPSLREGIYLASDVASVDLTLKVLVDEFVNVPGKSVGFRSFRSPTISNGIVTFWADDEAGGQGIYRYDTASGELRLIADTATPVPNGVGTFTSFQEFPVIDNGVIAFIGRSSSGEGIYLYVADVLIKLVATGDAAPNEHLAPRYFTLGFGLGHHSLSRNQLAFQAATSLCPVPTDAFCDRRHSIVLATWPELLTFRAEADSYVRSDLHVRENDNYGAQDFVEVGTGRLDAGQADKMRALVRFNLGVVPPLKLNYATLGMILHSYDQGLPDSVYKVDAHPVLAPWTEGNGFEGSIPASAPATVTDPDTAFGVAWSGAGQNSDPFAANNDSQPGFDSAVLDTKLIRQDTSTSGEQFHWDLTDITEAWLQKSVANNGIILTDTTTDGSFRGVRFGSREGLTYSLVNAVDAPVFALSWMLGSQPEDLTGDGCIDRNDLNLLMAVVRGQAVPGLGLETRLDLNSDGKIDVADARRLVTRFSKPLGASCMAR